MCSEQHQKAAKAEYLKLEWPTHEIQRLALFTNQPLGRYKIYDLMSSNFTKKYNWSEARLIESKKRKKEILFVVVTISDSFVYRVANK